MNVQTFTAMLNNIRDYEDYKTNLMKLHIELSDVPAEQMEHSILRFLHQSFNLIDDFDSPINFFCWEDNFGRNGKLYTKADGTTCHCADAAALWDFLHQ